MWCSISTAISSRRRSSTLAFFPLAPCRVIDTRNADGPLGRPDLAEEAVARISRFSRHRIAASRRQRLAYSLQRHGHSAERAAVELSDRMAVRFTAARVSTLNAPTGTDDGQRRDRSGGNRRRYRRLSRGQRHRPGGRYQRLLCVAVVRYPRFRCTRSIPAACWIHGRAAAPSTDRSPVGVQNSACDSDRDGARPTI